MLHAALTALLALQSASGSPNVVPPSSSGGGGVTYANSPSSSGGGGVNDANPPSSGTAPSAKARSAQKPKAKRARSGWAPSQVDGDPEGSAPTIRIDP